MEEFKFKRVYSGERIGSLSCMLKKVKAVKLRYIAMKNGISGFHVKGIPTIINELIEKLTDLEIKNILSKIKDKYIHPSGLVKFTNQKNNMINFGLILYEKKYIIIEMFNDSDE